MTTNFYSAQEDFNRLISSLPPFDLSKFVIWLDLKISEYKIFGRFVSEPEKEKSIAAICPQYQQSDFMNNNHCRSNATAPQKSNNHKNFCAKIFHEVAQQTDENKTENVQKSSEFRNNVCALKNKTRYVIGEDENSTTQKIQKQDTICAKIFHEVAQQTDENKAEKLRRSLEIQDNVYITEDGHRSLPFQIIESYGNVNEAEIHGTIDKACDSSNTNVNTDTEFLRGQGKDDNECQTEGKINLEESFNGEMKEDVVNVLIEVENTGPIEQKNSNERLSSEKGINPDTISEHGLSSTIGK
ncbi:uncharacterized protein [Mytilus edulis]|uniref:uncharacterized protein n=1 Tax=Mytilus edulis TaxID=6550 RepID=UPI0039EE6137